VFCHIVNVILF